MKDLKHCKGCGFISALLHQFVRIEGLDFCKDCEEAYKNNTEPASTWVKLAIQKNEKF